MSCAPVPGVGWISGCRSGARCLEGACAAVVWNALEGQVCGAAGCVAGLYGDSAHVCRKRPTLAVGDLCGISNDAFVNADCPAGSTCGNLQFPNGGGGNTASYTCLALPGEGSPALYYHCASGLFAQYSDGQPPLCQRLRALGEPCSWSNCAEGLECRSGKCAATCQ